MNLNDWFHNRSNHFKTIKRHIPPFIHDGICFFHKNHVFKLIVFNFLIVIISLQTFFGKTLTTVWNLNMDFTATAGGILSIQNLNSFLFLNKTRRFNFSRFGDSHCYKYLVSIFIFKIQLF